MRKIVLTLCLLALACGCYSSSQTLSLSQKAETLKATETAFVSAVKIVTILKAAGALSQQEIDITNVLIHQGQACLNQESAWLKNPVGPEPVWFDCAISVTNQLLVSTTGKEPK
jgi:hypothetical protein